MKEITQEMLALAAKGNQYAIEDLYRLTYNSVYKTTKVLIQDEDTVLDIVQDSYVKAFQSLDCHQQSKGLSEKEKAHPVQRNGERGRG